MPYKKILLKDVGKNRRYYKLEVFLTLFDDYIVERECGNVRYKSPTGIRKNIFSSFEEAKGFYLKIMNEKISRGYRNGSFAN